MKKVVPFTKTITFKTMIAEITDIEVTHTLSLKDNNEIEGDILVDGKYKMTDASQIEEEFHYKLPFMIDIDSKYNLEDLEITIGDFYFEIINEEDLKINVEIDMDGIEEKKEELIKKTAISLADETEVLDAEEKMLVRNDGPYEMPIPIEIGNTNHKLDINPLTKLETEIEEDLKNEETNYKHQLFENESLEEEMTTSSVTQTSSNVGSIFSQLTSSEETFSTYYVYIVRETDTIESIIDKYKTTREELQNYNDLTDVKVGSKLIIPCAISE